MCVVLGVWGRGDPRSPECVCPLSLYVNRLSWGLSGSPLFRDSLLVLVLL